MISWIAILFLNGAKCEIDTLTNLFCSLGASIILAEKHILQNVEKKMISITVTVRNAVLCMGTLGSCAVVPRANEPHNNLCMLYSIIRHDF